MVLNCDFDLEAWQGHNTFKSWTITVWDIIQIQHGSKELWPRHGFWLYMHLDLESMTLAQNHDTEVMENNIVK